MKTLRKEMREYYQNFRVGDDFTKCPPTDDIEARRKIISGIEKFHDDNPDIHPSLLKAELQSLIAENFNPRIFRESPFFFEMGMRPAEFWGIPYETFGQPSSWMHNHFLPIFSDNPEASAFQSLCMSEQSGVWSARLGFDEDHHCVGYTHLLKTGVNGVVREINDRAKLPCSREQRDELTAMRKGCLTMLRVAERFHEHAEKLLETESDENVRKNLQMISEASGRIPAEPPRSFYEGLAALCFLREVVATLEGIGVSVIGHPDRQLIELYRADIASGTITKDEAKAMIAEWMAPHDVKTFAREREWPETSTCLMLGGCDVNGKPVWNEITKMFIETHREFKMLNPKLNCRYSSKSPDEYLQLISELTLAGHNNFALLNDDTLIPAQIKHGKTLKESRLYVNGGCQETICEGVEHSAGAFYYVNMVEIFSIFFSGKKKYAKKIPSKPYKALRVMESIPSTFEDFYNRYLSALKSIVRQGAEWSTKTGREFHKINPCPLFSTTLKGCVKNAQDYKSGGAAYNASGITLVGIGDIVNSLNAVRILVYDEQLLSLDELRAVVGNNWRDAETLRERSLSLPRYGQGDAYADKLARRFAADVAEFVRETPNERGEFFQPSFFVYWSFKTFGDKTGATPDGRHEGEVLSQGIAPHRLGAPPNLTDVVRSVSSIDFTDYPGNAVLDIQLPAGGGITPSLLAATIKTVGTRGIPTLQLNCVSPEDLIDAQQHPERHADLVVRISGLSAVFTQLNKDVQDEIISRSLYAA